MIWAHGDFTYPKHPITQHILEAIGLPDIDITGLSYTQGSTRPIEVEVTITTTGDIPPVSIEQTYEHFYVTSIGSYHRDEWDIELLLKPGKATNEQ